MEFGLFEGQANDNDTGEGLMTTHKQLWLESVKLNTFENAYFPVS